MLSQGDLMRTGWRCCPLENLGSNLGMRDTRPPPNPVWTMLCK
jgi:hypothetical protein